MLLGVWTWFSCRVGERSPVDYSDPAQSPEYDLRMIARSRHIMNVSGVICCLILVTLNDSAVIWSLILWIRWMIADRRFRGDLDR